MEREPVDFIPATAMRKPRRKEWYGNNEKKKENIILLYLVIYSQR
jgi:hypothetical protein